MSRKIELVRELCDEIKYLRRLCRENNIEYKREITSHLEDEESIINSFEFDSMTETLLLLNNVSKYNSIFLDENSERKELNNEKLRQIKSIIDIKGEIKVSYNNNIKILLKCIYKFNF
ncbi:hypothetical protein [Cryptosporidium parvum Iowa II]|uniref:Uncharacterized protein n=2 Tax=Cryptosporidium parvum TaxID=5807 RepID=Q5CQ30_CRYPI|nr:hypothetical protein [Cryptosporidium parvum Iowa II]EAK87581.1 hypothetical protein cgd5_4340 [Cryptosporidium parvum Iowa II]QOY41758.1 Uncharacterized protein CPATCC_0025070 [Cryptosporidium parvum]WKS77979.1 hypothetical protein CPCDC_5g4340 [Cryptosporidium sp. 43IA8]|eukprot:QOY41758.1 hypothetical protein CPATCC_002354 [Cryptosporidium parvum]